MQNIKIRKPFTTVRLKDLYWKVRTRVPKTSLVQLFLAAFILFALPIGVFLAARSVIFRPQAELVSAKIFISPETQNLPPNSSFRVMIDSSDYKVAFARVVLRFDPTKLQLTNDISLTTQLATLIFKTTLDEANTTGRVVLIAGLSPSNIPPSGVFEFATIFLTSTSKVEKDTTSLTFDQDDIQLVDLDTSTIPITFEGSTLNLNWKSPVTPLPLLTLTPTTTSIPLPTATLTPTLAPTSTSTPTPSPQPTIAPSPISGPCTLTSARWVATGPVIEGTQVTLSVTGQDCDGRIVSFEVKENDSLLEGGFDDGTQIKPPDATFVGNTATTTWLAEFQRDCLGLCDPPEYYFNVTLTGYQSSDRTSNLFENIFNILSEPIYAQNGTQTLRSENLLEVLEGETAGIQGLTSPNDWPQLQYNAAHTGWSPVNMNLTDGFYSRAWRWLDGYGRVNGTLNPVPSGYDFSGMVQPIVANSRVFIGSMTGEVYAINAANGNTLWHYRTGGPILHTMAYDNGKAYVASTDHKLYAFDDSTCPTNGGICNPTWSYETGGSLSGAVTIYNGVIYIGSSDKYIYAIDAGTGQRLWRGKTGGPILSTPAVADIEGHTKVFVGAEDMYAYAFYADICDNNPTQDCQPSGSSGWTSPQKLYGASFRNFWPVVSVAHSLVFFTTQFPDLNAEDGYWGNIGSFLSCLESRGIGGSAEMDAILNGNSNCPQYAGLNNDNERKTFFALRTFDGVQPFQIPITHFASNGTTHVSPIIAPNGDIYAYYQVWDQTVFEGQGYAIDCEVSGFKCSPDLSKMNPLNGYRIPINIGGADQGYGIANDNVPVKIGAGGTIVVIHRFFKGARLHLTPTPGVDRVNQFFMVTYGGGYCGYGANKIHAWEQAEAGDCSLQIYEFPPEIRGEYVGESGASVAQVGTNRMLFINAGGGMLVAVQDGQ